MSYAPALASPSLARHTGLARWSRRFHALAALLLASSLPAFLVPTIGASWGATLALLALGAHLAVRALPDWYRCPACGEPASGDAGTRCCSR